MLAASATVSGTSSPAPAAACPSSRGFVALGFCRPIEAACSLCCSLMPAVSCAQQQLDLPVISSGCARAPGSRDAPPESAASSPLLSCLLLRRLGESKISS